METIFTYTRQDAIEDGVLVDVSACAKQAGFKFPVAITERVYNSINNIPPAYDHEDYYGRLWDVLTTCRYAAKNSQGDTILFQVILHTENNLLRRDIPITLKAICHGGDHREPVITIMFTDED